MSTGEYLNGNTAIGENALDTAKNTSSRDNSAFGFNALRSLNPGANESTAIGSQALRGNQTGENTAIGHRALAGTLTETDPVSSAGGDQNTAVGSNALRGNHDGDDNTAIGVNALIASFHCYVCYRFFYYYYYYQ